MNKKNGRTSEGTAKKSHLHNTSASAQRQRLLSALRDRAARGVDTLYARDKLEIMAPAPRIKELRVAGFIINTFRVNLKDTLGVLHRGVGRYILISEPGGSQESLLGGSKKTITYCS